jgi:hypothetical protein
MVPHGGSADTHGNNVYTVFAWRSRGCDGASLNSMSLKILAAHGVLDELDRLVEPGVVRRNGKVWARTCGSRACQVNRRGPTSLVSNRPQRTVTVPLRDAPARGSRSDDRRAAIAVLIEGGMQVLCEAARRQAP